MQRAPDSFSRRQARSCCRGFSNSTHHVSSIVREDLLCDSLELRLNLEEV
jgi:hypothetical protein